MKKIMSFMLAMVLILSTAVVSSTAYMDQSQEVSFNQSEFSIDIRQVGNTRIATVKDEKTENVDVVSINDATGEVVINGHLFTIFDSVATEQIELFGKSAANEKNWSKPTTSIQSLSFASYTAGAIVGFLSLTYGVPGDTAAYIAGLVIGAGGFLYVKSVSQLNYVDYSPKVGYRLTETLHLDSQAKDAPLYSRTMTGSR